MRLGDFVEISISISYLAKSLSFFERLGFRKLYQNREPLPWAVLTDGSITLNLTQYARPTTPHLNYFSENMAGRIARLKEQGVQVLEVAESAIPELRGVISTPSGVGISLMEYDVARLPHLDGKSSSKCGTFREVIFPVRNLLKSAKFWTAAGYEEVREGKQPYPWCVLSDGLLSVGLHQSPALDRPAFWYSSDNPAKRIEKLKKEGFEFVRAAPLPDGTIPDAILEAPEGNLFLIVAD